VGGKTVEKRYSGSPERVYTACRQAVAELGYAVLHTDAAGFTISFNTGRSMKSWSGQDLSATVFTDGTGSRVVVGGSLAKGGNPIGGGSQVGSWGEKSALSNKFLDTVARLLPRVPEPAAPKPAAGSDLAAQLAKLAELRKEGLLDEQEYADAKAALIRGA